MFVSLILEPCSRRGLDEELRGAGGLRGYKCWRFVPVLRNGLVDSHFLTGLAQKIR